MFRRRSGAPAHLILALSLVGLTLNLAIPAPRVLASVPITASMSATNTSVNSDTKAEPGDTISYTTSIQASGGQTAPSVTFNDTPDGNTTLVPNSLESTPIARPDSYSAYGNVPITISSNGVLSNDGDPDGDTVTLSTPYPTRSANLPAGSPDNVSMNANGTFTYAPPPGFQGTDTFTYHIGDGHSINSVANSDTGTVSITVSGMVWFIDNSQATNGDGRLNTPFNNLASFNSINSGAAPNAQNNDAIFLYDTSGNNYTGPLTLRSGQKLIGQAASADLATIASISLPTGSAALPTHGGTRSAITLGSGGSDLLTVNSNNLIRGLDLTQTGGTGTTLRGTAYGTLNASEMNVSNTGGGPAISLVTGTLSATFGSVTATGGAPFGVIITGTSGTFSSSGGAITGTTGNGAQFAGASSASTIGVTLSNMTFTNDDSSSANGSCTDFTGATCNAVVHLTNANGVSLTNVAIDAGTGSTHAEQGIYGSNVSNFTFTGGFIKDAGYPSNNSAGCPAATVCDIESGILFSNLTGSSSISNTSISNNAANDLEVRNNSGTLTNLAISGVTFGAIGNGTNTNDSGNSAIKFIADGNSGPVMNLDLEGSTLTGLDGYGLFATDLATTTASNAHMGFTIGKTAANTFSTNGTVGLPISIAQAGAGITRFDIENNSLGKAGGSDISINLGDNPAGGNNDSATTIEGTINNNTIGTAGIAGSGGNGNGIQLWPNNVGHFTVAVTNNHVYGTGGDGIQVQTTESPTVNVTVTGNTVDLQQTSGKDILVQNGRTTTSPQDSGTVCADIKSNTLNLIGTGIGYQIRLWQLSTGTISLPGYTGGSTDTTAVANFEIAQNTFQSTYHEVKVTNNGSISYASAAGFSGGSGCTSPNGPPVTTPGYGKAFVGASLAAIKVVDHAARTSSTTLNLSKDQNYPAPGTGATTPAPAPGTGSGQTSSSPWTGAGTTTPPTTPPTTSKPGSGIVHGTANLVAGTPFAIGDLPAGHTVTLFFQATVNNPINNPAKAKSATNNATISATGLSDVTTSAKTELNLFNSQVGLTGGSTTVSGQQATVTAHVSLLTGTGTPSGTVQFWDGAANTGTALGSAVSLDGSNNAQLQTSTLSAGSHTITAVYSGDTSFNPSSNTIGQTVNQADTTTTIDSSLNPSRFGQSVTFTATIAINSPGTNAAGDPTGAVTFFDGGTPIGSPVTVSTSGGVTTATISTSGLSTGTHTISASYGGDSNFNSSSVSINQQVSQSVQQAGTTTSIGTSVTPSKFGQSVTFTATVAVAPPGACVNTTCPTGTVTFTDHSNGDAVLGTGTLSTNGGVTSASFTTSSLTSGTHVVKASYGGDTNFNGSTSTGVSQTVIAPLAFTSQDTETFTVGEQGTFTINTGGGTGTKTITEQGSLPSGLTFNDAGNGSATISGTAAVGSANVYPITLTLHDGFDTDATQSFTLTVANTAGLTVIPTSAAAPNSAIILVANGYTVGEQVKFNFNCATAACQTYAMGTLTADGAGTVTFHSRVPDFSPNTWAIGALGTTSNLFETTQLTVTTPATLTASPSSGAPGVGVTLTGAHFRPNETVTVKFNCAAEDCSSKFVLLPGGGRAPLKVTNLGPVQADGNGAFTKTFTVPNYTAGVYPIGATGSQSLNVVQTNFTITGNLGIQIAPTSGPGGMNAVITGQGFQPNEQVTLKFNCTTKDCSSIQPLGPGVEATQRATVRTLGPVGADNSGSFSKNVVIPNFNQGTWTIGAIGSTGDFTTTTFTITAPLAPAITVNPNSGVSGASDTSTSTQVTVNGTGYLPNETVTVRFNCATANCGSTQLMGTPTTDGNGAFTLSNVPVPSKWSNGVFKIGAKGGSSNAFSTADFTVTGQA